MHRLLVDQIEDGRIRIGFRRSGQEFDEPPGEPTEFLSPLGSVDLEDLRWYLEEYLAAPFAVYEERGQRIQVKLVEWGRALFEQVFGPGRPGRDAYMQSREGRCELVFRSASSSFLSLPWELLQDPQRSTPLALDVSAIDRSLVAAGAAATVPQGNVLRILMVIARPGGTTDIGYQMIARPLVEQLAEMRGKVELEVLRPPTLDALDRRLREAAKDGQGYHIVHFDGHGTFGGDANADRLPPRCFEGQGSVSGQLSFEVEGGGEHRVAAEQFALVVASANVPIVVMNACRAGYVGQAAIDAGVATQLLQGGAASVVAMAYTVYAAAAADFMTAFYTGLFAGRPVSEAVNDGRRSLYLNKLRPSPKGPLRLEDWIVPVHYRRRTISFPELARLTAEPAVASLDALRARVRPAGASLGSMPRDPLAPDRRFVGRDSTFYDLELALQWRHVVILHGSAGMGKTEVAKAFGRWWRSTAGVERPEHVVFHSFKPGVASFGLDGVLSSFAAQVFKSDFTAQDDPELRYDIVLEKLRQSRLLLIWDNFESVRELPDRTGATPPLTDSEQARIRGFLEAVARDSRSGVIITSRTPEWWVGQFARLKLDGLGPGERIQLADDILRGRSISQERRMERSFGELMEWLGGHPLSLRLVLPHLEDVSASELLDALKGHASALPEGLVGEGMLDSLGASLRYSMDHLSSSHHRQVLALSLFESVTDQRVLGLMSSSHNVPNCFSDITEDEWSLLLDRLAAIGILTALRNGMYAMHPALPSYLVVDWKSISESSFSAEYERAEDSLLGAYAKFSSLLVQGIEGGSTEAALAAIERQRRTMGRLLDRALANEDFGGALHLLEALALFWDARGLRQEARGWLDRCEDALERRYGSAPPPDSAASAFWQFVRGTGAEWAVRAGQFVVAKETYESIGKELEKSRGWERQPRLSVVYHQLGRIAQLQGDLDEAESWYRRALEIRENMHYEPGVADSYHQLGMVSQLRGRLDQASLHYHRALEIRKRLDARLGIAAAYHQLGIVAQLEGKIDLAIGLYNKAREIWEKVNDIHGCLAGYHQLGTAEQERPDFAAAEAWFRKALAIAEEYGDEPARAASYHHLGMVAEQRKNWPEAEAWYRRALEIRRELDDRPNMSASYGQLGLLAEKKGNFEEAMDWTVRCVTLFKAFPDPATGPGPHNLARMTRIFGWSALRNSWGRVTGMGVPDAVIAEIARLLANDGGEGHHQSS